MKGGGGGGGGGAVDSASVGGAAEPLWPGRRVGTGRAVPPPTAEAEEEEGRGADGAAGTGGPPEGTRATP